MAVILEVFGPFRIKTTKSDNTRTSSSTFKRSFYDDGDALEFGESKGLYVFCLRHGDKTTPWYVGKTTTTFNQECFTPDKQNKYQLALDEKPKSSPYMFFVTCPGRKFSDKRIAEVEKYLIRKAYRVNEDLLNIQHAKKRDWRILGVMDRTQGKPSYASSEFKTALGIHS